MAYRSVKALYCNPKKQYFLDIGKDLHSSDKQHFRAINVYKYVYCTSTAGCNHIGTLKVVGFTKLGENQQTG